MEAAPQRLTVDAGDDLRLHVERVSPRAESRQPRALLLLHGFTSSSETWNTLRPELSVRHDVVTVDLPGHGRSSSPTDPARYALDRVADDLARVLDTLGVERAAVLGYSFGGRAALKFVLRHPRRVAALVLESTSSGIEDPVERTARVTADAELADVLEHEGIAAFVDRWEMLPLWTSQAALPEATRAKIRERRLAQSPIGLANALRGAGAGHDPAVFDRLGEITVPVLIIAGALDPRYVDFALRMSQHLPDSRVEIVPDAGHAVHIERPGEYRRIVEGFLASLRS